MLGLARRLDKHDSRFRSPIRGRNAKVGARPILTLEALEERNLLSWSSVPPPLLYMPIQASAVTLNAQGDAQGNASIATTENDYYTFVAPTSGSYTFRATTPSSNLDTVLGVFDAGGYRLAYNDDTSYFNRDSQLTMSLTAGSRYYLGVTSYTGTPGGSYTWTIDGPAAVPGDDGYENNDSFFQAANLGTVTGTRTISNLMMADAADWFRFTTTATGSSASRVSLSFQHAQGDLDLELYNASGSRLGISEGTGNSEAVSLNGWAAGTYYIRVYGYNGARNPSYGLTIAAPAPISPSPAPSHAFPDVAYYGGSNEWNVNAVNAPESWALGYTGEGVVVAIVDTGVDLDHPDLVNQIWVNRNEIAGNGIDDDGNGYVDDVSGWDFVGNDNNPNDGNGHGTHVAGIVAAEANGFGATGVAPGATIMPIRALDNNGYGSQTSIASGIRYAAQNGADIINLSLGGAYSTVIQSAIEFARSLDVLVVVASGNEYASTPSYPARFSASMTNVISVGAHNSSGGIASFSNDVGGSGAVQVDGPGVSIYSTWTNGGYARLDGTSMAAPHVAGLAALALSANRSLSASHLRAAIVNGANRLVSGSDSEGGINAALTVALVA
jgi:subtilisin family serine protease